MTTVANWTWIVVAVLVVLVLQRPTAGADVSGKWMIDGAFDDESVAKGVDREADLACTFRLENSLLTGSCGAPDGSQQATVRGEIKDHSVHWTFEIAFDQSGQKHTMSYAGTLDNTETTMRGTFTVLELRGAFTATKQ